MAHRLSCPEACGIFLDPGIEPVSPALAGGLLTTGLAGSPFYSLWNLLYTGSYLPLYKSCSVLFQVSKPVPPHCLSPTSSAWLFLRMKVKVAQLCLTLFDTMDYTVHGILLARILEGTAIPFSRGSSQPRDWTGVSYIAGGFFSSWATRELTRQNANFLEGPSRPN